MVGGVAASDTLLAGARSKGCGGGAAEVRMRGMMHAGAFQVQEVM